MNQPMWPFHAERAAVDDRAGLLDVLLVFVDVLPVLEHGVDLAVSHGLEDGNLGDLGDLDLTAEILFEHRLGDVGVRGRAGPGLLVQHDLPAVLGRRSAAAAITAAAAFVVLVLPARRDKQRECEADDDDQNAPSARRCLVSHEISPHCG